MKNIEENKTSLLKNIKAAISGKKCIFHSVGNDKTSYQGNQKNNIITVKLPEDEAR